MFQRRHALIALASASACAYVLPSAAFAAPTRYKLDPQNSHVGFRYRLNGASQNGSMVIKQATIIVDPQNLAASKVDVTLDVIRARTGLAFITQVMTGPEILDAAQFPTIRFVSRRIILGATGRISEGAKITGDLTLRGVTRSITLNAALYRRPGTSARDLSQLDVELSGGLNRHDFGASGYPKLVSKTVILNIKARIRADK